MHPEDIPCMYTVAAKLLHFVRTFLLLQNVEFYRFLWYWSISTVTVWGDENDQILTELNTERETFCQWFGLMNKNPCYVISQLSV